MLVLLMLALALVSVPVGNPGGPGACEEPAIECEWPDKPLCWCSEVTDSCEWYCWADPIGGLEARLVCKTVCIPGPYGTQECYTTCTDDGRPV